MNNDVSDRDSLCGSEHRKYFAIGHFEILNEIGGQDRDYASVCKKTLIVRPLC